MTSATSTNPPPSNAAALSATASGEARFFANAIASWYLNTIDPYAPHIQNIESRLRHPVHVVTRRILYGNVHATHQAGGNVHGSGGGDLEAMFNDDDAEIKDGPEALTRRSAARMEAFLASCSTSVASPAKQKPGVDKPALTSRTRSNSNSASAPSICHQIDRGDLLLRLEVYCKTLRRIRCLLDADPSKTMKECMIQYEPKKAIRSRIRLIVQTYLRNVDCVRDVHKTLMTLVLRATLEVLAVEVWCPELRDTVTRLASEYEHKVSFGSLAFLSSPDNSVETHLLRTNHITTQ